MRVWQRVACLLRAALRPPLHRHLYGPPPLPADLSKPGKWGPAAGPLSLTERIINRFSQPFFAQVGTFSALAWGPPRLWREASVLR